MKVVQRIAVSFLVHLRYPGKSVPEAIPHDRSESIVICVAKDAGRNDVEYAQEGLDIAPSEAYICQFGGEMPVPAETDFTRTNFELFSLTNGS
ncbi:hypothetical protein KY285_000217 [Solanum tuberosum]|nr:hypothetical protein KY284_000241 [Solanum tuberosum]KAH0764346.1 hypothetical protein KY285_000217 [Solanum tuberosum]